MSNILPILPSSSQDLFYELLMDLLPNTQILLGRSLLDVEEIHQVFDCTALNGGVRLVENRLV